MIRGRECLVAGAVILVAEFLVSGIAAAQPPRPFPQPSQPRPTQPARPAPPPPAEITPERQPPVSVPSTGVPTEEMLGAPVYPSAQYITSYDAGRGQRFFLFGVNAPFAEMVNYYRNALKVRGEVLFEEPATHQFELARFRDELMAFPPSITIKDYTFGGSAGYPNPRPGVQPERFATIIQIVPVPR